MTNLSITARKNSIIRAAAPYTGSTNGYVLTDNADELQKLKEKYGEDLVNKALQIKAGIQEYIKAENTKIEKENSDKNEEDRQPLKSFDSDNTLSAEYYINLAKNFNLEGLLKASLAVVKRQTNGCPINDPKWAGYSYEEIIQMENNGCVIPQEVLRWAHAQQEADITAYVIVSDNTTSEDETSKTDNDINSLQKKVKQYVQKAESEIEKSEKAFEEYTKNIEKATKIKKEKENSYKDEMNDVSQKTKEWKELDEKKKSKSLTKSEQKRYKELGKEINGADGKKMKEIQNTHSELDEFLDSIDSLNKQVTQNVQVSLDTMNATIELSKLTRNFADFTLPHDTKEAFIDDGLLANTLQNTKGDEIAITAIDTTRKLDDETSIIDKTLNSNENIELAKFSDDYTNLAEQTENNTKDAMGEDYEKEQNNENEENQQKEVTKDKYSVAKVFSFANAIIATETTEKSVAELKEQARNTEAKEKSLKKTLRQSEKDIKNIEKESNTLKQKQETNATEEERFLEELESINSTEESSEEKAPEEKTEKADKKDSIMAQIENLNSGDEKLDSNLKKNISKGASSTEKSQHLSKLLRGENQTLVKLNNNTKKVAMDTMFVGTGTASLSYVTGTIGYSLVEIGTMMMSWPPTAPAGAKVVAEGVGFIYLAALELSSGLGAVATGINALVVNGEAQNKISDSESTEKDARQTIKDNRLAIKESLNSNNEDNTTKQVSVEADTSSSTENGGVQETEGTTEPQETNTEESAIENKDETETEPETEAEAETENNEITEEQNKKQDKNNNSGYSVVQGVGAAFAVAATAVTTQASIEINLKKDDTLTKESQLHNKLNAMKQLEKENDKVQALAEKAHKKSTEKANESMAKIDTANLEIEQGLQEGNEEKTVSAQIEISNINAEMNSSVSQENSVTSALTKSQKTLENNIKTNKASSEALNKDVQNFNKLIDSQLDVSEKTLTIGAQTIKQGIELEKDGIQLFAEGAALLPSPMGVTMQTAGTIEKIIGIVDIVSGGLATVAGSAGIIANDVAKKAHSETKETLTAGDAQLKKAKQKTAENQKLTQSNKKENQSQVDEITAISASATNSVNTQENTSTSDKEDRKLTRFNEESIIESKKKRKKVMAVSASTRSK